MQPFLPVALASLLVASAANATTMRALSTDELIDSAERIVIGTVESRECVWAGTRIFTHYIIAVDETWRGPASETLGLLTMGGVVGTIGQHVAGAANLRVGERVVLFLVPDENGAFHPVGMWQGVFHVTDETASPEITRIGAGTSLVGIPPIVPSTLSDLRQVVTEAPHAP